MSMTIENGKQADHRVSRREQIQRKSAIRVGKSSSPTHTICYAQTYGNLERVTRLINRLNLTIEIDLSHLETHKNNSRSRANLDSCVQHTHTDIIAARRSVSNRATLTDSTHDRRTYHRHRMMNSSRSMMLHDHRRLHAVVDQYHHHRHYHHRRQHRHHRHDRDHVVVHS